MLLLNHCFDSKPVFENLIKRCNNIAGIVYKFNNRKVVSFLDNFKYIGDLPFTVYFDFETTAGDSVTDDKKMFVISYCQIYAFHPSLNLDKIVIFRSFQQNFEEINRLDHFSQDHIQFFDPVAIKQRYCFECSSERKNNLIVSHYNRYPYKVV